jgi:hypothetical protein
MRTLWNPDDLALLQRRFATLTDAHRPRWGRMTCAQMIRHVAWGVHMATGERPIAEMPGPLRYFPLKQLVLYVLPFPRSAPTARELRIEEMADVTTNVTGASIKEILFEIDRLRNEPATDAELRGIQNYLAGTFVLRNSNRPGIANQLAFLDLYGLSDDYLRNYVQRVYALTPADIQRMARTYVDPAKLAIVVVGDRAQVAEQLRPYGEVMP